MPLVRIDLPGGIPENRRRAIGDAVQEALHGALGVPSQERFQVVAEHDPDGLIIDPSCLGVDRSSDAVIVQVTPNKVRDAVRKLAFVRAAVEALESGPKSDLPTEDWSFGNGEAQLA